MKIAVIGGASSYTPELVDGLFSRRDRLPISHLTLMDPDAARLGIVANFSRRLAKRYGVPTRIDATGDLHEALDGATYVVTQIRVGGMRARIGDERLGRRHGVIGQETTGVGGFACALRTIPAILKVARAMPSRCPGALLLNFTNPAGIITEAVLRHGGVPTIGLCNIPIGIEMEVARLLGCAHGDVALDYVGLNHLSWIDGVTISGEDRSREALDTLTEHASEEWEEEPVCDAMVTAMGALRTYCNPYLQYFYATETCLERQAVSETTRGEDVLEIEAKLFEKYADPALDTKPEELSQRGGAHYSTAALQLMEAIHGDAGSRQIVCCRNDGAIPTFDDDDAVEVPARIGRDGAVALPQPAPPAEIRGLMQQVKAYERLTVEAAVTGDRRIALQAMLANPLMPGAAGCEALLDDLIDTNADYLTDTFCSDRVGAAHGG